MRVGLPQTGMGLARLVQSFSQQYGIAFSESQGLFPLDDLSRLLYRRIHNE